VTQCDKQAEKHNSALLYGILGEALGRIQLLEDALSHSITLKKDVKTPFSMSKAAGHRRRFNTVFRGQGAGYVCHSRAYGTVLASKSFCPE